MENKEIITPVHIVVQKSKEAIDKVRQLQFDPKLPLDDIKNRSRKVLQIAFMPLVLDRIIRGKAVATTPDEIIQATLADRTDLPTALIEAVSNRYPVLSEGQTRDWEQEAELMTRENMNHPLRKLSHHLSAGSPIIDQAMAISFY